MDNYNHNLIVIFCRAGPAMEHLIGQGPLSSEKLCQLLLATLRFPSPQRVLVTAAAAVGDLSRRAFKHIKPMVPQLLREVFICLCSCGVSILSLD